MGPCGVPSPRFDKSGDAHLKAHLKANGGQGKQIDTPSPQSDKSGDAHLKANSGQVKQINATSPGSDKSGDESVF